MAKKATMTVVVVFPGEKKIVHPQISANILRGGAIVTFDLLPHISTVQSLSLSLLQRSRLLNHGISQVELVEV